MMFLTSQSVRFPAPSEWSNQISANGKAEKVALGVRPEHIRVSLSPVQGAILAEIFVVEDLGNELLLDMRVDGQPIISRVIDIQEPNIGDPVWLSFDNDDVHVFDPVTQAHLVKR